MISAIKRRVFGTVLIIAVAGAGAMALAQDRDAILKDRQTTMKQQGKDAGTVKGYLTGKADQAAAVAAATDLTETTRKIPDLFPPGSGGPSPDGDFQPKPTVWTDWDKFLDAQKAAAAKADALLTAIKAGDKAAIQTAFADLGKNGCGNCHTTFREKLKN
jgi:cytochrome c556